MKFVVQRVSQASVEVDGEILGKINRGFMILIGVADSDTEEIADKMIAKMLKLRILMMHKVRPICRSMKWAENFY